LDPELAAVVEAWPSLPAALLALPEGENIGKAINEAMKGVEAANEELKGVLPKSNTKIENSTLVAPLKKSVGHPRRCREDTFGKIYEYFLGNFARAEGQTGRGIFYSHFAGQADRANYRTIPREKFQAFGQALLPGARQISPDKNASALSTPNPRYPPAATK
jgi:hypothetical protein